MLDDTIAAISTPLGDGGIGIVRLSGPRAIAIADALFKGQQRVEDFASSTIHYGVIIDPASNEIIDEVLLSLMRAPKSYTREDVVEINCHGGILPLRKILELTLKQGARLAQPGEFTKRAYLNGRIDLVQAEAVIDVVRAKTLASLKVATYQLKGGLSERISSLRQNLIDVLAKIEASIDFEEEEIQEEIRKGFLGEIERIRAQIQNLIETAQRGCLLREGIRTVILGRPNVGKSSLLNALVGRERAIVTNIPGTTRDTIEEAIDLEGIPLRIIDTAGIRKPKGIIEQEGIRRTLDLIDYADLLLLVIDSSQPLDGEDREIFNRIDQRPTIVILNKMDLPARISLKEIEDLLPDCSIIKVSAILGTGLDSLRDKIKEIFFAGGLPVGDGPVVTHLRHKQALEEASLSLNRAIEAAQRGEPSEFIALDLREAVDSLGEILGERLDEEILERIFSKFCIGK